MQEIATKIAVNGNSYENMSSREQEVLKLLLEGDSSKEIASRLHISPRTVDYHRSNIYKKLDVHNYQELIASCNEVSRAKHSAETPASVQTEIANSAREWEDPSHALHDKTSKTFKLHKFLIPAAIFVLFCLVIPLWYLTIKSAQTGFVTLKPSKLQTEFSAINFPFFLDRTFDEIHLRVNRWEGPFGYGENWSSGDSIKLSDIFSSDVRNILRPDSKLSYIKVSGYADKTLHNSEIHFHYVIDDKYWNADDYEYQWLHIGGSGISFDLPFFDIPKGKFEVTIPVKYNSHNDYLNFSADLPQGKVVLQLNKVMYNVHLNNELYNFNSGKTPEEIPNHTIMATIKNLKIEPVFIP